MEWYESWFDSPWYPLLYQQRDESEAAAFIEKLLHHLNLPTGSSILDLACGRGRHARCMASMGMRVTGIDLSEQSLDDARSKPMPNLEYIRHDMRHPIPGRQFDAVFNLFTSFGYFDEPDDDWKVMRSARAALHEGGFLVIDYLNPDSVLSDLPCQEEVERMGVQFMLRRHHQDPWILKDIVVSFNGETQHFQEKVRCFTSRQLGDLIEACGLQIKNHWGDYELNHPRADSPRTIFICQNPN
jgi:SAM-dependent methyltransferase